MSGCYCYDHAFLIVLLDNAVAHAAAAAAKALGRVRLCAMQQRGTLKVQQRLHTVSLVFKIFFHLLQSRQKLLTYVSHKSC